jgi:hypothetical protein
MRNFIAAVTILLLIIIFTVFNSVYICSVCDDITNLIDEGKINEAKNLWNEKCGYISIFVRDAEIDVAMAESENLNSETPIEDGEAVLKFREAVAEIKDSENPTFKNIF